MTIDRTERIESRRGEPLGTEANENQSSGVAVSAYGIAVPDLSSTMDS